MLADSLRERVVRVAELNGKLAEQPGAKNAGDWIAEIGRLALNRQEERHLAVVSQVRRLRRRVAVVEAMPEDDTKALAKRREALQKRVDAMAPGEKSRGRFLVKLDQIDQRIADGGDHARQRARLPAMKRRIAELLRSGDVITKEDLLDG